jgi:uncharacterized membrane protein
MTNEEKINLIGQKILLLSNNLDKYQSELLQLKQQLDSLQQQQAPVKQQQIIVPPVVKTPEPVIEPKPELKNEIPPIEEEIPVTKIQEPIIPVQQQYVPLIEQTTKPDFNFEEFIGGKLITIIGIIILVIGLGIGVKYAIDNDMLGPLARIVLAYVAGGILLVIALKLKAKYKTFSAVLLSGGMASLYFTTFIAYSVYENELGFHQLPAFIVMLIFTIFTVYAATVYELQIIGIIGLVGAYAVPMLLSDGSGRIEIMFSYMAIINIGILVLSFKKYWQVLNHIAFGFTWLIFIIWYASKFIYEDHAILAMTFAFLFFLIFYISNMSYKILKQEKFGVLDVIRIVSNSFIFFGIGYATLDDWASEQYLGLFTVANALVHFVFSYIVFKNKLLDRKLFYLLIALVLSFITIAVPVQLEGNWVTLFWAAEAVLLFSIGRYKAVRFYEWLGYIMILLAIFSLLQDWGNTYYMSTYYLNIYKFWTPVLNVYLFTSLFVCAALGSMIYVHHKKALTPEEYSQFGIYRFTEYALPVILFCITYATFSNEISAYYKSLYEKSLIKIPSTQVWAESGTFMEIKDESLLKLKDVMLGIYNQVFFIGFCLLAIKLRKPSVRWAAFAFNMLVAIAVVTVGLTELGSLRYALLSDENAQYYATSSFTPMLRYVCFALFGVHLFLTYTLLRTDTFEKYSISKIYLGCIVHFFILIILSNELVYLQTDSTEGYYYSTHNAVYKLGFTALWGIYSFALIAFGIFKKNKIMRISAICLFGITLLKLLIYDTWDLSTGYKVISYMLLGVILLIVSFLYQKFKTLIFGDDKN